MPFLDWLLIAFIILLLPLCCARPWIGILAYTWLSCMFPFRIVGGLAYDFPMIKLVAVATLAGLLFTKERYPLPRRPEVFLVAAMLVLFTCTTWLAAFEPTLARQKWAEVLKVAVMAGAAVVLLQDRQKLRAWLLVIALSFGFYGVTGGIWGLWTRFGERLFGPPSSVISDNNAIGFIFTMVLPLLGLLRFDVKASWLRHVLLVTFTLTIMALLATYSRGALVGFAVVAAMIVVVAYKRDKALLAAGMGACLAVYFTPQQWVERMQTIQPSAYRTDSSGVERMKSWYVAWRIGLDHPLLGAGFHPFSPPVYERYIPGYTDDHDAHNHFLQMFAEHGFTGLVLFVTLLGTVFWRLVRLAWTNRGDPDRSWMARYAEMLIVSLAAYVVGGAFFNSPHLELLYSLIAATLVLDAIATSPLQNRCQPVDESIVGALAKRLSALRR